MKALAVDPRQLEAVVWAVLLGAFALCCVALAGLTLRLHRLKRTGPRKVCFLLLLSFLLRTAWLAWYYFFDTDDDNPSTHYHRSPLQTLEVMSRLNLNLTFTAVSSLVTLWLRALSADPGQKARIKRFHQSYNILLYTGSITLELLGLLGGEALKGLTFFSTLWTSGMALGYLLGAMGFGLHLSRGQRQDLHGLNLYRYIRNYTRKLQTFTLVVAMTYLCFLALFLVGMVGNGREGTNEVTPQSLPLHESALGIELLLALLIILGVRQPLGGPTPLSIAAATVVAGAGAQANKGESATLVWTSPRSADNKRREKKGQAALDDDVGGDSLRAPLLGGGQDRRPQSPISTKGAGGVAHVVEGEGGSGSGSRR